MQIKQPDYELISGRVRRLVRADTAGPTVVPGTRTTTDLTYVPGIQK